jgi:DNA modification methylase
VRDPHIDIYVGDAIKRLRELPDKHFHTCVTSPPYWNLRDYRVRGQIGREKTPEAYIRRLVKVFREVRRVLRDDGTLWVNMGDIHVGSGAGRQGFAGVMAGRRINGARERNRHVRPRAGGLKDKDLVGLPWMLAFALRADGWYLRRDIIWEKDNPMPESCKDRPSLQHEYVFLFSKKRRYFYDSIAIQEPATGNANPRMSTKREVRRARPSNRSTEDR